MSTSQPSLTPMYVKVLYSLGQAGWNLVNSCFMLLLIYFYIPPEIEAGDMFPEYVERRFIFLSFTVVGLLMFAGTIISAITDVIMGPLSDKAKFKFGRRRTFLVIAFIPLALFTFTSFYPLTDTKSIANIIWLSVSVIGFNIFLSVYVTPYNGLLAELGHTQKDRVVLSTLLALTWGIGFMAANTIFALKSYVANLFHINQAHAFQYLILLFCLLAVLLMALPIIFVNEDKYCKKTAPAEGNPFQQMIDVLKITKFRRYMFVELFYWFSTQFLQLGIAYYVTVLMGLSEQYTSIVIIGAAVGAFITFPIVVPLTEKYDKKKLLLISFALFSLLFIAILYIDKMHLPIWLLIAIVIVLNAFPMAIFGILPMALVSDMAVEDAANTGKSRSATFYGIKFFIMKIGLSLTGLIFPTLLVLGKSTSNSTGIRLTAVIGLIGSLVAMILMSKVELPKLDEEVTISKPM